MITFFLLEGSPLYKSGIRDGDILGYKGEQDEIYSYWNDENIRSFLITVYDGADDGTLKYGKPFKERKEKVIKINKD